jgi:uncharacterized integral membrane protein (TIGR00698 family)
MGNDTKQISTDTTKIKLNEDWAIVIIGWFTICILLFGIHPIWPIFSWKNLNELFSNVLQAENIIRLFMLYGFFLPLIFLTFKLKGIPFKKIIRGFSLVFIITISALIIGNYSKLKHYGLEPVIFSLLIGLTINNIFKVPQWLKDSLQGELYTKIGLVILGTSIIFGDIIKSGILGLIQALVVVISVWYFAYWICKKLKIDHELTMMLSSAVSICGVSAAIATAGAIKGDTKKLSYIISLVLVTAIPMIIIMPFVAKWMGLSEEVTGAWLGGSIDTTGAVVASGSMAGEAALKTSTIIKFSQNILLGIAALLISIYWTYTKKETEYDKPGFKLLWDRFPKFVIGFIFSSLFFSIVLSPATINHSKDVLKNTQGFWFALAFTCIGLETNLKDLLKIDSGKPIVAFLTAQLFNVIITLALAYLLFS